MITNRNKGYAYALLATLCGSLVYLFSKAALQEITLPQFGFWWFSFAIFWNTLFALHPRSGFSIGKFTLHDYGILIFMGIVEIIATSSLYAAIEITDNPTVPSFLRNLEYLFITLLGIHFLSEKFSLVKGSGALLILAGAFIISFRSPSLDGFMSNTALLMLSATTFYALRTILAKIHIREISPVVLALNRSVFLLLFALAFMTITGNSFTIPGRALLNILAGSFVGPFLTSIFQYSALKYIEASRAAIVQSTTGLFVLTGALLMFGTLPGPVQISGGAVTIAGVMLMMYKGKRKPTGK